MPENREQLIEQFNAGSMPALARAISLVENEREGYLEVLGAVRSRVGNAHRIGLTGPPGAGKSTLTSALVAEYRKLGMRVGVIAIDPTSPFTGGALLGDRVRMEDVAQDEGVYIRSLATRGAQGGLSTAAADVLDLLDAFGMERIIVESVGVGQSELDILGAVDTCAVVLVPESGDSIQTLKAGLMEIADLFVVNKADRPGADALARDLSVMLGLRVNAEREQRRRVLQTVATEHTGVPQLREALEAHWSASEASGELIARRKSRVRQQVRQVAERMLSVRLWTSGSPASVALENFSAELLDGRMSPRAVAARIVEGMA